MERTDLRHLSELCANWDNSSESFARIVAAAIQSLGVYQRELASQFEVAESTVSRWANGVARPHPRAQKLIVAAIEKRIQYALRTRERARLVTGPTHQRASATVMIVDDNQTVRRSVETLLSQEGYEVITASDSYEALGKISGHQPDVVLVDISMPRVSGYEVCALIKRDPRFSETPVIMLSSSDRPFDPVQGRIVGSDKYLTKPFTREQILTAVKSPR